MNTKYLLYAYSSELDDLHLAAGFLSYQGQFDKLVDAMAYAVKIANADTKDKYQIVEFGDSFKIYLFGYVAYNPDEDYYFIVWQNPDGDRVYQSTID